MFRTKKPKTTGTPRQSLDQSAEGTIRNSILFPGSAAQNEKRQGSGKAKDKPIALILHSPNDPIDSQTNYGATVHEAELRGYKVYNKSRINFGVDIAEVKANLKDFSALQSNAKELTIWVEAHGAPGWLFGTDSSHVSEREGITAFRELLLDIEKETGLRINNILLNSCYSANEMVNDANLNYVNSSARLLSILVPDKVVVGLIGKNTPAGVRGVYELNDAPQNDHKNKGKEKKASKEKEKIKGKERQEKTEETPYQVSNDLVKSTAMISQEVASVAFKDGYAIEASPRKIFCDHQYTQAFILEKCPVKDEESTHYWSCLGREEIDKLSPYRKKLFADNQIERYQRYLQEHPAPATQSAKERKPGRS